MPSPGTENFANLCFQLYWTGRHVIFVAAFKLQFGSGWAHNTIWKSFLQDEAKKIAKDETETDVFNLAERSGRADKVSSSVTQ